MKNPHPLSGFRAVTILCLAFTALARFAWAVELPGDRMLQAYFEAETKRIEAQSIAGIARLDDWQRERPRYRAELLEMLGLSPLPSRTDLKPVVTGRVEHPEFYVEKLHFQSLPGLYVGANLYVPKGLTGRAPAILYACGHGRMVEGGVSYGNKTAYQHHGAWFARHGYVCLMIDTIQLGELPGVHAGTRNDGLWWWNSRGYTPAGVEVWNSMRALDYLQSRPEVDGDRLGMTGRSGGGAYTWYSAALDDRVKVAVAVAGITDLRTHVIDGVLRGHCDCMYMVNTYRWDFAKVAALLAPRPLLFANSDKDAIFPLEGVLRVHRDVARIYRLHNARDQLGLLITDGPHGDTQDLQVPAFRWFNRFLKGETPLISVAAEKLFKPAELKVFATLPSDELTTRIHHSFVPAAAPAVPTGAAEWTAQKSAWRSALKEKSFAGWPEVGEPLAMVRSAHRSLGGVELNVWEFDSQGSVRLPLFVFTSATTGKSTPVRLHVLDQQGWDSLLATVPVEARRLLSPVLPVSDTMPPASARFQEWLQQVEQGALTLICLPPRGIGPTRWSGDVPAQRNLLRRFMLLGQTLESMRVWDTMRAIETLHHLEGVGQGPHLRLSGEREQAVNALYASLFAGTFGVLELISPPASHQSGPDYLNVLRTLDVPQAVALAMERQTVKLTGSKESDWAWTVSTARALGWSPERLQW